METESAIQAVAARRGLTVHAHACTICGTRIECLFTDRHRDRCPRHLRPLDRRRNWREAYWASQVGGTQALGVSRV